MRVDTALVRQSGGKLETIAGLIPEPPATFRPAGTDALSTAIAGRVSEVVDPVIAQMPITKEELTRFAQNVMKAADNTTSPIGRLPRRSSSVWVCSRTRRVAAVVAQQAHGGAPRAGSAGGLPGRRCGGQSDQMGQLMQMPMQMAQQAAQIPMQLASMAAAIPQAMMQGVQSAVQQATQMAQSDEGEEKLPAKTNRVRTTKRRGASRGEGRAAARKRRRVTRWRAGAGSGIRRNPGRKPRLRPSPRRHGLPSRGRRSRCEFSATRRSATSASAGRSPPPGNPYPPQGYPGPQQPWAGGPPPKKRGNGWKWGLGALALLVVIGVTAAVTISVTGRWRGGSTPAGETFGLASADDKGPVNVITEDPSCAAWGAD